jgi:uncharacterized protein YjlB
MAVTYSATPMGNGPTSYRSVLANALISAGVGTPELVTLVHRLSACPHEVRLVLRSACEAALGFKVGAAVRSYNASQVLIDVGVGGAGCNQGSSMVDVICEYTQSVFQ